MLYCVLSCVRLCNIMDFSPPGSSVYGDSPGENTGVGCHALLQGISPTRDGTEALMSPASAGRFITTSATCCCCWVTSVVSDSVRPHRRAAHQAPPSLGFSRQEHLAWVAISFSNAWKWKVKVKSLSRVWLLVTPWTVAHQAPSSMAFSGSPKTCLTLKQVSNLIY